MTQRDEFLTRVARFASIGLGLGGLLALAMFGVVFYQYHWTGERQLTSTPYIVVYYGVPIALTIVFFASLWLRPIYRINLLMIMLSAGLSIYALEFILDWRFSLYASTKPVMTLLADSEDKAKDAAALGRQSGRSIDVRTAEEALADLQRADPAAVPIMTASNHLFIQQPDGSIKSSISIDGQEVMPLAAVSGRTTLLCDENGEWIHYRSDERGFNNPAGVWQTEQLELAVLGDSFAHGYCVPNDRNFVTLIRQRHPATLNLGVAGNGPLLMTATLEEYLPKFRPKTVLWFYFEGNDLTDLQTEMKSPLLRNYMTGGFRQPLLSRQADIDQAMVDEMPRLRALGQRNRERRAANRAGGSRIEDFVKLAALRQRLGMVGGATESDMDAIRSANLEVFRGLLRQAKTRVESWGGQLTFVYLPDWSRYTSESSPGEIARDEVLAVVRDLKIPMIDIHDAFQAHGDPLSMFPFRRPGHYTESGHQVVADAVLNALSER